MNIKTLATIVVSMQRWMPESSRTLLAHKILREIALDLQEKQGTFLVEWVDNQGPDLFLQACELESGLPHTSPDMCVQDTDLANFCNRWMNIEEFRLQGSEDEFKPITGDMHVMRFTIINELKDLADAEHRRNTPGAT